MRMRASEWGALYLSSSPRWQGRGKGDKAGAMKGQTRDVTLQHFVPHHTPLRGLMTGLGFPLPSLCKWLLGKGKQKLKMPSPVLPPLAILKKIRPRPGPSSLLGTHIFTSALVGSGWSWDWKTNSTLQGPLLSPNSLLSPSPLSAYLSLSLSY